MGLATLTDCPGRVEEKDDGELYPEEENKMGGGRGGVLVKQNVA